MLSFVNRQNWRERRESPERCFHFWLKYGEQKSTFPVVSGRKISCLREFAQRIGNGLLAYSEHPPSVMLMALIAHSSLRDLFDSAMIDAVSVQQGQVNRHRG